MRIDWWEQVLREREREKERESEKEREGERERESVFVCLVVRDTLMYHYT